VERTRIRRAEERDAPAIARLHLGSYRAAYQGLVPSGFLAGNSRARAFCEAVGWRPEGRTRSHLVSGVEVSEVRYVIEPGMCGTSVDGPSASSP
jgi:hypothetical protein